MARRTRSRRSSVFRMFRLWHLGDMPAYPENVRSLGVERKSLVRPNRRECPISDADRRSQCVPGNIDFCGARIPSRYLLGQASIPPDGRRSPCDPAQKYKVCDLPHIRLARPVDMLNYNIREGPACPTTVPSTKPQALICCPVSPWSCWPLLRSSSLRFSFDRAASASREGPKAPQSSSHSTTVGSI